MFVAADNVDRKKDPPWNYCREMGRLNTFSCARRASSSSAIIVASSRSEPTRTGVAEQVGDARCAGHALVTARLGSPGLSGHSDRLERAAAERRRARLARPAEDDGYLAAPGAASRQLRQIDSGDRPRRPARRDRPALIRLQDPGCRESSTAAPNPREKPVASGRPRSPPRRFRGHLLQLPEVGSPRHGRVCHLLYAR